MNQTKSKKKALSTKTSQLYTNLNSQSSKHPFLQQRTIKKYHKDHFLNQQTLLETVNTKNCHKPPIHSISKPKIYHPYLKLKLTHKSQNKCISLKQNINELITKLQLLQRQNNNIYQHIHSLVQQRYKINDCSVRILKSLSQDQRLCSQFQKYEQKLQDQARLISQKVQRLRQIQKYQEQIQKYQEQMIMHENRIQQIQLQKELKQRDIIKLAQQNDNIHKRQIQLIKYLEVVQKQQSQNLKNRFLLSFFHIHILYFQQICQPVTKNKCKKFPKFINQSTHNILCLHTQFATYLSQIPFIIKFPLTLYLLQQFNEYKNNQKQYLNKISYFSQTCKTNFKYNQLIEFYNQLNSAQQTKYSSYLSKTWHLQMCELCSQNINIDELIKFYINKGISIKIVQKQQRSQCLLICQNQ